jgi:DNA-directed RNA polymerase specialized sigma24 family protein
MATRTADWPSAAHQLALIAANDDETEERRNRALSELRPLIERAAADVAKQFRDSCVKQDLLEDCFFQVTQRLPQFRVQEGGSFNGWLYRVLYHLGCDLRRRRGDLLDRARTGQAGDALPVLEAVADHRGEADCTEAAARLADLFVRLRKILDRIGWEPSRAVDYYALLLVELRVRMAACFTKSLGVEPASASDTADRVERWLPWREAEGRRRFRADLPILEHYWRDVRERLGKRALRSLDLVEALNRPLTSGHVSVAVWDQWMKRMRRETRQRVRPGEWESFFARLLPERAKAPEGTP